MTPRTPFVAPSTASPTPGGAAIRAAALEREIRDQVLSRHASEEAGVLACVKAEALLPEWHLEGELDG